MNRKSTSLYTEYEPENDAWKLKDTDAGHDVLTVPDDGNGLVKVRTAVSDPTDVSGSRSKGTEYQNTDDYSKFVSVTLQSDGTQEINASIYQSNSSGLGSSDRVGALLMHAADISDTTRLMLGPIEVPPGGYYKVDGAGAETIAYWKEWNRS